VTSVIVILKRVLIDHKRVGYGDRGIHPRFAAHARQPSELLFVQFDRNRLYVHPTLPSRLTATSF
jgi:hypothetical protein